MNSSNVEEEIIEINKNENNKNILMNNLYNSTDGIVRFISDITNKGITLSKGILINWNNELSNKLSPELSNIEEKLSDFFTKYNNKRNEYIKENIKYLL